MNTAGTKINVDATYELDTVCVVSRVVDNILNDTSSDFEKLDAGNLLNEYIRRDWWVFQ